MEACHFDPNTSTVYAQQSRIEHIGQNKATVKQNRTYFEGIGFHRK